MPDAVVGNRFPTGLKFLDRRDGGRKSGWRQKWPGFLDRRQGCLESA